MPVTEWLERSPLALKVSGSRQLMHQIFQNFLWGMGTQLFRDGEGEGCEGEAWHEI